MPTLIAHNAIGPSPTTKDSILETGTATTQSFVLVKTICAHLNAFHVYVSDPSRSVEANHYYTHPSADVRQCLIYDAPTNPARLIGVDYMITPKFYEGLDEEGRKLWHSHDYEVKSGMLTLPNPIIPNAVWEIAEMEEVDRGDVLPLGKPELTMSFTRDDQVPWDKVKERDERFGVETLRKRVPREGIESVEIHLDADGCLK